MTKSELKDFLNEKYVQYNNFDFIEDDPIKIPHSYSKIEDVEILRFIENGINIKCINVDYNGLSVDTPEDVIKIEKLL